MISTYDIFFAINHVYCNFYIMFMSVPENLLEYIEKKGVIDVDEMSKDLQISEVSARNYLSRLKRGDRMIRIGRELID